MKVSEGGRTYDVVIIGSPNVNAGYKLVGNAKYPQIADDYPQQNANSVTTKSRSSAPPPPP